MTLKEHILQLLKDNSNNSRKVISILKKENVWDKIPNIHQLDSQNLYDFLFEKDKHCLFGNLKFVNFSVGYNYCSKKCSCYIDNLQKKVSQAKKEYSENKKEEIKNKRKKTNLERYGVENLFSDSELVKKSMLEKYGVENARQISKVNQKIANTNLERYGVDNPSKNQEIKLKQIQSWNVNKELHLKKFKKTMLEKYGVENARHIPEINQKIVNTNLERYGVDNPSKNQEIKNKISTHSLSNFYSFLPDRIDKSIIPLFDKKSYKGSTYYYNWKCLNCENEFEDRIINGEDPICRKCHPYSVSVFEKEIRDFVEIGEYNNRNIISPYEIDIYIPTINLAIECNGVYRHSELSGKDKNYHLNKTKLCEEKQIRLIQILDVEWKEKKEIVKSIINSALGKNKKIHARKCKISSIDYKIAETFLNQNHIQGSKTSKINYGLFYDNQLVSVMTFGKSRYNKQYQWELIRFANLINFNVIGAANKLFNYFVNQQKPTSVISYCDKRLFSGTVYSKLGFLKVAESKPGYYYFNVNKTIVLESREKYQKHKLKSMLSNYNEQLSEWENMKMNSYDRIWNCGNSVWSWSKL
jgi:hypothetical protein